MTRFRMLLLVIASGCGVDGGRTAPPVDAPVDPTELSPIERCLAGGGSLHEQWAAGNQHGAVTSIAVGGTTIVLGSVDGSVKQWNLDGSSASYGTPLVDDTGIVVDALAFTGDDRVIGTDREGQLSEWRLSDARPMRTTPIAEAALTAVAISPSDDQVAVAAGPLSSEVRVVARDSGAIGEPLSTSLWGVNAVRFGRDRDLYLAGHVYGEPSIERRSVDAPATSPDIWIDHTRSGHVHAITANALATQLVAAGDDFVVVLDASNLASGTTLVHGITGHRAIGVAMLGRDTFATVGAEGTLRLWSLSTAEPIAQLEISEPIGLGVDAAGEHVFTSGPDGDLHAYDCR